MFRADASPSIGGGHVMRCLTLAHALSETGWRCRFACSPETASVVPALERSGFKCLAIEEAAADEPSVMARLCGDVDLLIVDHYGRDAAFERTCRPWAKRIMVIDDLADRPHDSDFLLDQTLGREDIDYSDLVPGGCGFFLGPTYALLRPEFAKLRNDALARRGMGGPVKRILVSMGAADPHNVSAVVLEGVGQSGLDVGVDVVAGAGSRNMESLRALAARMPKRAAVHEAVDDMAGLMVQADLAIGAAGSTSWERCCLGLPCLTMVTADNQEKISAELENTGAVVSLGRWADVTPDGVARALRALAVDDTARARMSETAAGICDGGGAHRVVEGLPA